DDAQRPVPIGVPGELWIAGAGLARGYHHRPELTSDRFRDCPFWPGQRMYRTGDLARWRADGCILHLGRNDQQIKLRGHRIELGEIEEALLKHPAVKRAAVVLREAPRENGAAKDARLVAYVVGDAPDLRDFARRALPAIMVPEVFVTLAELPTTPN